MKAKILQKSAEFPKEILNPFSAAKQYSVKKYEPSEALSHFIECLWVMRWDSSSELPYVCEVLPSPYVNLTFMPRGARITGVPKGKLIYELETVSPIFGVQFKSGGFYPFWQQSLHQLTDDFISADKVFSDITTQFNTQLLRVQDDKTALKDIEKVLLKAIPTQDKNVALIGKIICDATQMENISIAEVADKYSMSVRSLQALFKRYVGVGLKWIVLRDRLQKAVQLTLHHESPNWSSLAVDLGYVDQSHFINDFKGVIGVPPAQYSELVKATL